MDYSIRVLRLLSSEDLLVLLDHHQHIVKLHQLQDLQIQIVHDIHTSCQVLILAQYPRGITNRSGARPTRISKIGSSGLLGLHGKLTAICPLDANGVESYSKMNSL